MKTIGFILIIIVGVILTIFLIPFIHLIGSIIIGGAFILGIIGVITNKENK